MNVITPPSPQKMEVWGKLFGLFLKVIFRKDLEVYI